METVFAAVPALVAPVYEIVPVVEAVPFTTAAEETRSAVKAALPVLSLKVSVFVANVPVPAPEASVVTDAVPISESFRVAV
jgi:hypothetical protein